MTMRVAVAASGRGSNLEALLRTLGTGTPARVVLVLSDRASAGALTLARSHGVATQVLADPANPDEWLDPLERAAADLVVLAGYLKLVPRGVVERYRGRIVNIHPALLPAFGGRGMYGRRVHEAVIAAGVAESGIAIHLVDEEYDRGPVIARRTVAVEPGDTPESLEARVTALEPAFYVETLQGIAAGSIRLPEKPSHISDNIP